MLSARLRSRCFLALMVSLLALGIALYLEHYQGLTPCPLCHTLRALMVCVVLMCLCAVCYLPSKRTARWYIRLSLFFAACGVAVGTRLIWLQSRDSLVELECAHPMDDLLEHAPLREILEAMLIGSQDCATLTWSFFNFSVPEMGMLTFLLVAALQTSQLEAMARA